MLRAHFTLLIPNTNTYLDKYFYFNHILLKYHVSNVDIHNNIYYDKSTKAYKTKIHHINRSNPE